MRQLCKYEKEQRRR